MRECREFCPSKVKSHEHPHECVIIQEGMVVAWDYDAFQAGDRDGYQYVLPGDEDFESAQIEWELKGKSRCVAQRMGPNPTDKLDWTDYRNYPPLEDWGNK